MAKTAATKTKPAPARSGASGGHGKSMTTTAKNAGVAEVDENDVAAMAAADAGRGVSTLASDNIVPLIYILQAQSPQCLAQKQECIKPGLDGNKTAVAGNIWFRGTKDLIDGEKVGMLVQLCHMRVTYVEWGPERGDGLRGRHDSMPKEAKQIKDPKNPKKSSWVMPDGNVIVETREHAVLVHREDGSLEPYVIPMSGSNHNAAKTWMTAIGRKRIPGTEDVRAPIFGYMWRMMTIPKSNDQGAWHGWRIDDEDEFCKNPTAYKMARQLHIDFEAGSKRADAADDGPDQRGDDNDDMVDGNI